MAQQWSYLTRPAKWVERHVLLDSLARLSSLVSFDQHLYVGMGGLEFIDFELFHRALRLPKMISIERNTNDQARYEANRPYACVTVEYGDSAQVLPNLQLEGQPVIAWLDYQDPLSGSLLAEVMDASMRLEATSLLIVTLNAEPGTTQGRVDRVRSSLGEEVLDRYLPDAKSGDLTRPKLARLQSQVLRDAIRGACDPTTRFVRLLDVMYSDDAPMQTVALLVESEVQPLEEQVRSLDWSSCEYTAAALEDASPTVSLQPPMLTLRERQALDQYLPNGDLRAPAAQLGISRDMVSEYARMYRWYPRYVSAATGS